MEYVRYIGTAHRRQITADDFRAAGHRDQGTVEWSYRNNFSVPVDQFSDKVLDEVIRPDASLVIVGGEDHMAPRNLGTRQTPAQAAGEGRIDMNRAAHVPGASTAPSEPDKAPRRLPSAVLPAER